MITTSPPTLIVSSTLDERALQTIEAVLAIYREWKTIRSRIHAQIFFDFQLDEPTEEQVRDLLQQIQIFADVLRMVAGQIEKEAEETTDQLYTWQGD